MRLPMSSHSSPRRGWLAAFFVIAASSVAFSLRASVPVYGIEDAVSVAQAQNPDLAIARKKVQAARGGVTEARSGFLPAVVSSGLFREREHQQESRLRDEDYSASLRVVQNLYTGGAVSNQLAIARLNLQIQELEVQATAQRVAMDVRIAFNELLLNRAKIGVEEQSVSVLQEEARSQQQRFNAGTVGLLDVRRAEVALANEEPALIDARTQLKNSYLRLGELFGTQSNGNARAFEASGELEYRAGHSDLANCLARADTVRPEITEKKKQIEIEERQAELDRSAMRPQVEAFSGYEIYNERDPLIGREFNHGYVVGLNARWNIFDGYATRGKLAATHARRDAAMQALKATQLSVASEVRSAFFDIEQADHILASEAKNVQSAAESLELAKANLSAGLGTQLDILQAASDVTRTRLTRLSAIYQHNVALARLARACAATPDELGSAPPITENHSANKQLNVVDLVRPPQKLAQP
jgi:outer membrane protein